MPTEATSRYDAIFAMAVFRHGDLNSSPPPKSCKHRIRFADFERSVMDLSRALKPGGLLAIKYAMFRFTDTFAATGFETVLRVNAPGNFPLFGRDDFLLPDEDYPDVVFRKLL